MIAVDKLLAQCELSGMTMTAAETSIAIDMLRDGYGVEDIAVSKRLNLIDVRWLVARLRATGKLAEFFNGGTE